MNRLLASIQLGLLALVGCLVAWHFEHTGRLEVVADQNDRAIASLYRGLNQVRDGQVSERIVDLPETGGAWHLSIFVHQDWRERAEERRLVAWFSVEPRLVSLKAQTHDHLYTNADPMYRLRFAKVVPLLPAVMLQDGAGKVWYKAAVGSKEVPLPDDPTALGDKFQSLFSGFSGGPCPRPKPEPGPKPSPDEVPDLPNIPDLDVPAVCPAPAREQFPWPTAILIVLGVGVASGVIVLVVNVRREIRDAL
jgi:hypothetical protein